MKNDGLRAMVGRARRLQLVWFVLIALVFSATPGARGQELLVIRPGESVEGEIRSRLGEVWQFQGCAGDVVTLRAGSDDFVPFLALFDTTSDAALVEVVGDEAQEPGGRRAEQAQPELLDVAGPGVGVAMHTRESVAERFPSTFRQMRPHRFDRPQPHPGGTSAREEAENHFLPDLCVDPTCQHLLKFGKASPDLRGSLAVDFLDPFNCYRFWLPFHVLIVRQF